MKTKTKMKLLELISALYRAKDINSKEKAELIQLLKEDDDKQIKKFLKKIRNFVLCKSLIEDFLTEKEDEPYGEVTR